MTERQFNVDKGIFDPFWRGECTADVRLQDLIDNYTDGDIQEFIETEGIVPPEETGRSLRAYVNHVYSPIGTVPGYVVLSLAVFETAGGDSP